ncbi:hypothetical protein OSB04_030940 [Centaurea solstitialis]|uniref:Integrase zinc-binding domain-containing protein n=1 Tax=Centaurea solstitialis TaxID=347529 RepID=A0AA38VTT7_9ASTR|nr:hypothetical protein OSB04_030940 [Centaurea solstitialis]
MDANGYCHKYFEVHQGHVGHPQKKSDVIPLISEEYHASLVGGHSGEEWTYQRVASEVFWVGMKKEVTDLVMKCEICQRNKSSSGSAAGLLQPLSLPNTVWEEDTMTRKPADPEEELRWMAKYVAVVRCQVEKAKEYMLNKLYSSSTLRIEELLQEDGNMKRKRDKVEGQSFLISNSPSTSLFMITEQLQL